MTHRREHAPGDGPVLAIDESRRGEALVLTVTGEIDESTGQRLRTAIGDALDEPGQGPVVVDLRGVSFMGSTGVAVLVDADWQAKQRGGLLRVVLGDARAVIRPLEATGVTDLLAAYPGVEAAIEAPP